MDLIGHADCLYIFLMQYRLALSLTSTIIRLSSLKKANIETLNPWVNTPIFDFNVMILTWKARIVLVEVFEYNKSIDLLFYSRLRTWFRTIQALIQSQGHNIRYVYSSLYLNIHVDITV